MANISTERKVVLDTETTGKSDDGTPGDHRIIEIGCVELKNRNLTGRKLQLYVNPERAVDEEAYNVHHISNEFLQDKPKFQEIFEEFYEFIKGAELIIHNAKFDVGFINHEFKLIGKNLKVENICTVTDSIEIARKKFPGQRVSLDALCSKLNIDNSSRTSHGALLDSEILAEVYLALTGGQENLNFSVNNTSSDVPEERTDRFSVIGDAKLKVIEPTIEELGEHYAYMLGYSNTKSSNVLFGDEFLLKPLEGQKRLVKRKSKNI